MQSDKIHRTFSIPHIGLKIGIHHFEYSIDDSFFEAFEGALIEHCRVNVKLDLEKKETLFILKFFIDGVVEVICDRCAEPFEKEIFGDFQCLVKYKDEKDTDLEDDDEIMYIFRDETHIRLSYLIYDFINLSLPMKLTHPDLEDGTPGCDPEILKYLNNSSTPDDKAIDPRSNALLDLKNKN